MRPAIFLDKDGTLIDDVPYNVDPARIVLAAGARAAVTAFRQAGYALVVVSNQSGIARGLFAPAAMEGVRTRLEELLGLTLDGFYFCSHHAVGNAPGYAIACDCRKPAPGMLLEAARDLDLDLRASWMIGDILNDVEAGARAGCRTMLIDNGNETEWVAGPYRTPDVRVGGLAEAAAAMLLPHRVAA